MVEPGIEAFLLEKILVGATFHDFALINDQNDISGQDSRETMGDGQRGTILHQWLQGGLDQARGMGIEGAGRLIQDEDSRVFQNDARDGYALLLTTGELKTALAHDSIVAVIKLHDAIMDGCCLGCRDHLLLCSVDTSIEQVFLDCRIEQVGFLCNNAYEFAK